MLVIGDHESGIGGHARTHALFLISFRSISEHIYHYVGLITYVC